MHTVGVESCGDRCSLTAVTFARARLLAVAMGIGLIAIASSCNKKPESVAAPARPAKATGDPTLDYWLFMNDEFALLADLHEKIGDESSHGRLPPFIAEKHAGEIMSAPVIDVDPELLLWSARVAKYYAGYSVWASSMDRAEKSSDAESLAGTPKLDFHVGASLIADGAMIHDEGLRLRQKLSEKYAQRFPPCLFWQLSRATEALPKTLQQHHAADRVGAAEATARRFFEALFAADVDTMIATLGQADREQVHAFITLKRAECVLHNQLCDAVEKRFGKPLSGESARQDFASVVRNSLGKPWKVTQLTSFPDGEEFQLVAKCET